MLVGGQQSERRMKTPVDIERNVAFYSGLIEKHGECFKALNWGSLESQQLRFSILAQAGNLNGKTILDVGCGMGDFYRWLSDNKINVNYTGIDITPKMVEIARKRFPQASIRVENILDLPCRHEPRYDYVFCSGLFYFNRSNPLDFMEKMITRLFDESNECLAFNSLSSWSARKDAKEFHADPLTTLEFCKTLSARIVFRHDYHSGDFTIYLYKRRYQS